MGEENLPEVNPATCLGRRVVKVKDGYEISGIMRKDGTRFYLDWFDQDAVSEEIRNGDVIIPSPETKPGVKARVKYQM